MHWQQNGAPINVQKLNIELSPSFSSLSSNRESLKHVSCLISKKTRHLEPKYLWNKVYSNLKALRVCLSSNHGFPIIGNFTFSAHQVGFCVCGTKILIAGALWSLLHSHECFTNVHKWACRGLHRISLQARCHRHHRLISKTQSSNMSFCQYYDIQINSLLMMVMTMMMIHTTCSPLHMAAISPRPFKWSFRQSWGIWCIWLCYRG